MDGDDVDDVNDDDDVGVDVGVDDGGGTGGVCSGGDEVTRSHLTCAQTDSLKLDTMDYNIIRSMSGKNCNSNRNSNRHSHSDSHSNNNSSSNSDGNSNTDGDINSSAKDNDNENQEGNRDSTVINSNANTSTGTNTNSTDITDTNINTNTKSPNTTNPTIHTPRPSRTRLLPPAHLYASTAAANATPCSPALLKTLHRLDDTFPIPHLPICITGVKGIAPDHGDDASNSGLNKYTVCLSARAADAAVVRTHWDVKTGHSMSFTVLRVSVINTINSHKLATLTPRSPIEYIPSLSPSSSPSLSSPSNLSNITLRSVNIPVLPLPPLLASWAEETWESF